MLARVYLYNKEYANAETEATNSINNADLYEIVGADKAFLRDSKETIWALQAVIAGVQNTPEADYFIPLDLTNYVPQTGLRPQLSNKFEFEDKRRLNWLDSVQVNGQYYIYPKKYQNNRESLFDVEHKVILRLAEQFLIRSEARARLGRVNGTNSAKSDLNVIRFRANINPYKDTDGIDIMDAIVEERQRELFMEGGHRWFDLKRLQLIDQVLPALKGADWQMKDQYFPIPQAEIDRNPSVKNY